MKVREVCLLDKANNEERIFFVFIYMRSAGIEPAQPAWEAGVIPLDQPRLKPTVLNPSSDFLSTP